MKVVNKFIVLSILKTTVVTMLLCMLMLVSVQLFSHLDAFLKTGTSFLTILNMAFLYIPTALIYALSPSLLFSAAYTFSQLTANNELICLYNASFSQRKLVLPVILMGVLFSMGQFVFQETVAIPVEKKRSALEAENLGLSTTKDKRNITLTDYDEGCVFHAKLYNDKVKRVTQVSVILLSATGEVVGKVEAPNAIWNENDGLWVFSNALFTTIDKTSMTVQTDVYETYTNKRICLQPQLLQDNSDDIKTMEIPIALRFLSRMKKLDVAQYRSYSVDFAQRTIGCITPLVMLFIACTISYRFKKNVLLFTIIISISIAVIYYVTQMLTLILARQGVFSSLWGMVIPMIVILCIAGLQRLLFG
mgnify:CR=1 FL=1